MGMSMEINGTAKMVLKLIGTIKLAQKYLHPKMGMSMEMNGTAKMVLKLIGAIKNASEINFIWIFY